MENTHQEYQGDGKDKDLRTHYQQAAQRGGGIYRTAQEYDTYARDAKTLDAEKSKNEELLMRTEKGRDASRVAKIEQLQSKMIHVAKDKETAELMTAGRALVGLHRDVADVLDGEGTMDRRQNIEMGYKERNREFRVSFKGGLITMEITSVGAAIAASAFTVTT